MQTKPPCMLEEPVLDVAFITERLAMVVTRNRVYRVEISGDVTSKPLNISPGFIARHSNGDERLILGIPGDLCIAERAFGIDVTWEGERAVRLVIEKISQLVGLYHTPSPDVDPFSHVLMTIPKHAGPDDERDFAVLLFRGRGSRYARASLVLPVRKDPLAFADMEVLVRSECPPVDLRRGAIAMVQDGQAWVGPLEAGMLMRMDGLCKEHERVETIRIEDYAHEVTCVLRDQHSGRLRAVRVNARPWTDFGTASARHTITIKKAWEKAVPRVPTEICPPPRSDWELTPLRIAPYMDWMVARADVDVEGEVFSYLLAVGLY